MYNDGHGKKNVDLWLKEAVYNVQINGDIGCPMMPNLLTREFTY